MTTPHRDTQERLDAKKVLQKISGKRPGKPCGKSFIAADRKCGSHNTKTATGKRKLTEEGKKAAELLAAKVRARKGLADKTDIEFARRSRKELLAGITNPEMRKRAKAYQDKVKAEVNTPARKALIKQATEKVKGETRKMTVAERRAALRRKYGAPDDGSRIGKLARKEERRAIVGLGAEAEQPLGKRKRELVEKTIQRLGVKMSSIKAEEAKTAPKPTRLTDRQFKDPELNKLFAEAQKIADEEDRKLRELKKGIKELRASAEGLEKEAGGFAAEVTEHTGGIKKKKEEIKPFQRKTPSGKLKGEEASPRTVKIGGKQYDIPKGGTVTAGLDFNTLSSSANRLYVAFGSNGEPIRETRDPQTGRMQVARFREQSQAENFAAKINKALNRPEKQPKTPKLTAIEGGKKKDDRTLEQLVTEAQKIGAKYDDGTANLAAHREAKKLVGETVGKAFEKGKGESKDDRPSPPTSPTPQRKSVADINAELRKKNGITSRKRSVDSTDERIAVS